jgi:hypothetical protein
MRSFQQIGPHTRQTLGAIVFSYYGGDVEPSHYTEHRVMGDGPKSDRESLALIRNRSDSDEWADASAKRLCYLSREALRLSQELDQVERMFRALSAAQEANEAEAAARRTLSDVICSELMACGRDNAAFAGVTWAPQMKAA